MSQESYFFVLDIVWCGGYAQMAERFCKKYLESSKRAGKIFALLLFFSYAAGNMICLRISYLAGASFFHIMFLGLVLMLFQAETEKKIAVAAILLVTMKLVCLFISSGIAFLLLASHPGAERGLPLYAAEYLNMVLQFAAAAGAVYLLSEPLVPVLSQKTKSWYLMLAFPFIAVLAILDIAEWAATKGIMVRGEDKWNLYYNQLFSHGANLFFSLTGMCALCFYLFGMEKVYMEQKQKKQYQAKVEVYRMLEEQYRQMEHLRHDMKNHIIGLRGLLQCREWEKMEGYLHQMAQTGALGAGEEATGNKVVDALLYQKRKEAEKKQIRWEADMQVPKKCNIDDFDFCVLIGNILDNAIEACEKLEETSERFIAIRSGIQKCFFLLEVKNSTGLKDLERAVKKGRGRMGGRGIGLLNIQETSQKYHGVVETELENQIFTISVLLPISEPKEL